MTNQPLHPKQALFCGEKTFPVIPSCEHIAGSEKFIRKALELQNEKRGSFNITMDCEDGAVQGQEAEHAEMVIDMQKSELNQHHRSGVRIHDFTHNWKQDIDLIIPAVGDRIAYITIPKPTSAAQVAEMISYIQQVTQKAKIKQPIPIHVLIETHGALLEIEKIAQLPWMQVLDFGLMDFVSDHHGAIPEFCMQSPGQFEHALIVRAKSTLTAIALAYGLVPSHNVTLDLRNPQQTYNDAKQSKEQFGFLRMWSIYPTQIDAIIRAMTPDFSVINQACDILLNAYKNHWGPIQHAGKLHDRATYRYYWELIERARIDGQALPEEVENTFF